MAVKVSGPIEGGRNNRPFGATTADLAGLGYTEEEYFFEGLATRYRPIGEFGQDGRWSVEPDGEVPFHTRAVVRRPIDPQKFNGTVVVEWNNVSMGCEIFEQGDSAAIFDDGFAYVGVSAQRVGVHGFAAHPQGLVAWDPDRYGSLHIDDDTLSYGVFSEVAKAIGPTRPTTPIDPLGGLEVRKLLAVGGSQSAGRLVTYINAVQPIEQIFDGFIAFTWFGSGSSVDIGQVMDPSGGPDGRPPMHVTQIRDDLSVPVMIVNSECETLACYPVRQPDTERYCYWEVAGAPHGPRLHMERIVPKLARDGVADPANFDLQAMVPVPWAPVFDAALGHVNRWIDGGPPPPPQPLIVVQGEPPSIVRDDDGNAVGGVRVPEMDAPTSENIGAMEEPGPTALMGRWTPLAPDRLHALYPEPGSYLAAYEKAADKAVAAGVLRQHDADEGLERAKLSGMP
jgi:Alpha/beta hydrolase domain